MHCTTSVVCIVNFRKQLDSSPSHHMPVPPPGFFTPKMRRGGASAVIRVSSRIFTVGSHRKQGIFARKKAPRDVYFKEVINSKQYGSTLSSSSSADSLMIDFRLFFEGLDIPYCSLVMFGYRSIVPRSIYLTKRP